MTDGGLIAARFVHYVALALAFGALAYGHYGRREILPGVARAMSRLAVFGSVGVLFGAHAVLAATVAGLGGGPESLADHELWAVVLVETDFGRVWIARLLLALVLLLVSVALARRESRPLRIAGSIVAALLVASVALTGHAASLEGNAGLLHRAADAAHILAAMTWLGALPALLLLLRAASTDGAAANEAALRLHQFHTIGLAAVLVLVASGVVNTWFLVGSLAGLIGTPYGQVLLLKLALFALMLVLAARNRFGATPRLRRSLSDEVHRRSAVRLLQARVNGEIVLGVSVLGAVAMLGAMAPDSV
ncbi:copper homeostasis membrane protein CopD [Brevundimonas sp.]|uniref:copper homeostasis membrane protein CopD n=1 Tax=Brevundimonas sp. TaxID=1871086 RepID=UPI0025EA39D0|nr:copper homeostasis membrane protein CopD [Brevundimonas sp.]